MSNNSRAATIAVFITQILIRCLQFSCIMFLNITTACPSPVILSIDPVLLIAMLFQPSDLGDRHVLVSRTEALALTKNFTDDGERMLRIQTLPAYKRVETMVMHRMLTSAELFSIIPLKFLDLRCF